MCQDELAIALTNVYFTRKNDNLSLFCFSPYPSSFSYRNTGRTKRHFRQRQRAQLIQTAVAYRGSDTNYQLSITPTALPLSPSLFHSPSPSPFKVPLCPFLSTRASMRARFETKLCGKARRCPLDAPFSVLFFLFAKGGGKQIAPSFQLLSFSRRKCCGERWRT